MRTFKSFNANSIFLIAPIYYVIYTYSLGHFEWSSGKIDKELGWRPQETFESGIRKTVEWYLNNREWWSRVLDGSYNRERLGVGDKSK